jgi:hypothetical protein
MLTAVGRTAGPGTMSVVRDDMTNGLMFAFHHDL